MTRYHYPHRPRPSKKPCIGCVVLLIVILLLFGMAAFNMATMILGL